MNLLHVTTLLPFSLLLLFVPLVVRADKKVACCYGSWSRDRLGNGAFTPADIDSSLCSHLIYAFASLGTTNRIQLFDPKDDQAYKDFIGIKKRNPEVKVLLAIGGWIEGSEKYSQIVSNPETRSTFVQSVFQILTKYGFDGLDLDWEYPAARGGKPEDKQNFVSLVRELKAAFSDKGYELTAAVGATAFSAAAAYDIPQLSNLLDAIHVMTYHFHGTWKLQTGLNAPLNEVEDSIKYWLKEGASPSKLILGMGTYGHTWTLSGGNTWIGAPAAGPGKAGRYTRKEGYLGYNEICENIGNWNITQNVNGVYAYYGNQWVGYDDVSSIHKKVNLINKYGLAGGMIWSLELDDFHGKCHGIKFPLLKAMNAGLGRGNEVDEGNELLNNKPQIQKPSSRYDFKLCLKLFQQINSMTTQDKSEYVNSCLDILF